VIDGHAARDALADRGLVDLDAAAVHALAFDEVLEQRAVPAAEV